MSRNRYRVHKLTDGIDDMGSMNWDMFGAFVGAWIIVYLCIIKGVKSAGKVSKCQVSYSTIFKIHKIYLGSRVSHTSLCIYQYKHGTGFDFPNLSLVIKIIMIEMFEFESLPAGDFQLRRKLKGSLFTCAKSDEWLLLLLLLFIRPNSIIQCQIQHNYKHICT